MATKYKYESGKTYLSETTPIRVSNLPRSCKVMVRQNGQLCGEHKVVQTPGLQTITIKKPTIYSLIYDKSVSNSSSCLTYSGACTGFTPMSGSTENSWAQGNGTIFDAIQVGYVYLGNWVSQSKSAVPGSTDYNCFTRIPRIYQKVTKLDTNRVQLDIALEPFNGATLHPAFIRDGVAMNNRYIGRYLASVGGGTLRSRSGTTVAASYTRAQFRDYAKATGEQYGLAKYWDWDLCNKLYLFAYKNFDSQSALGTGYRSGSSVKTTGTSNSKSWMYTGSSTSTSMSFLGIEDYYGNAWWFIDDFYGTGGTFYAGSNSYPTDDTNNKVIVGKNLTTTYYPLSVKGTLNGFSLANTSGTSTNSITKNQQLFDSDSSNVGRVGGYYASNTDAGMFYLNASISPSSTSSYVSARLCYSD